MRERYSSTERRSYGHGGQQVRRTQRPPVPGEEPRQPEPMKVVLIVVVGIIIVLAAVLAYNILSRKRDPLTEPDYIIGFMDGSLSPMVNSTYTGTDVYIEVPEGADIEMATMHVSGALPPARMAWEVGRAPSDIATADIDGDGYMDLVAANYNDASVTIRTNDLGEGTSRSGTYPVAKGPTRIFASDLNGDPHPDILVISEDVPEATILLNDGSGMFIGTVSSLPIDPVPSDAVLADIDGDGDLDLSVISISTDTLTIYENDGSGNFQGRAEMYLGRNPTRICSLDIAMDGRTDLAVYLSQGNGTIYNVTKERTQRWYTTILPIMNRGQWDLREGELEYRVPRGVNSIAAGDLDGDGYLDLAMAHLGYKTFSVLYSDSDGFRESGIADIDVAEFDAMDPIDILIHDMDGDDDLDVMTLSKSADSAFLFHNTGGGRFEPYIQYYCGLSPTSFVLVDFDLDGDMDIATSDWRGRDPEKGGNGTVSVSLNMRNGIFGTYNQYRTGNSPRGIYTYDLDGDGHLDIATANYFGSTVSILKNDGVGGFARPEDYPIGLEPYMVVLGDLDNDGHIDGASADEANFRIILLESNRNGGFYKDQDHKFAVDIQAYPFSLRIADLDMDGDQDLYTSNYAQNSTTIMLNDGSGDFSSMFNEYITVDLGNRMPYDAIMEDVDSDGDHDLITVNRGDDLDPSDTISVFLNRGDFSFIDHATYKVGKQPTSATLADLDNDGDLDLATSNTASDSVSVLLNMGDGSFQKLGDYPVGDRPQNVNHLDIDDDGWTDLVVTNTESNDLFLLRNRYGMGFSTFISMGIGSYPYMISVNDLNDDGREEISLTSVNTARAVVQGCYYYPEGVRIDIGADGSYEFVHEGLLTDTVTFDFGKALSEYVGSKRTGTDGDLKVPIRVVCDREGVVRLSDLLVVMR